jgi:hypothetical protein
MNHKCGVLSYKGVEVLRMVEGAQKHSHNTIIPSKNTLQHCATMVELSTIGSSPVPSFFLGGPPLASGFLTTLGFILVRARHVAISWVAS